LDGARELVPMAREMKAIWQKGVGQEGIVNATWKLIHEWAPTDWIKSGYLRPKPLDDLTKLKNFQETIAARLAKLMGDTGNIAKQEAERAMNQLPLYDSPDIGEWKILRFFQRVQLAASRRYQLLDDEHKRAFGQLILDLDPNDSGKLENVNAQTEMYEQFLKAPNLEEWIDTADISTGDNTMIRTAKDMEQIRKQGGKKVRKRVDDKTAKRFQNLRIKTSPPSTHLPPSTRTEGEDIAY